MARVIGGIGLSHTPTIGFARDRNLEADPVWQPIFRNFRAVSEWLAAKKPDVLFLIYNDHVTSFFFDHYSAFTLGVGDSYAVADEGAGARDLPPVQGHALLARHIARVMTANEFDLATFQHKPLDHGCFSPLSMLTPVQGEWAAPIVPLQVGVLQLPIPTAGRCFKFGRMLRLAIESYPEDLSVVVMATGGLSHQIHGERVGFNNPEWDSQFLDLLERDPQALANLSHAQYARRGGFEAVEMIMWLIMRGAMDERVKLIERSYYLPSMTAIATVIFENEGPPPDPQDAAAALRLAEEQTRELSEVEGTYPFELESSARAYRLNSFLHDLVRPEHRRAFLEDPEAALGRGQLSEEEKEMVRRRDWLGMIRYGVTFFVLEKLAAVLGISNLHIYSSMKGMALDEFLKTRSTSIVYSVAANKD